MIVTFRNKVSLLDYLNPKLAFMRLKLASLGSRWPYWASSWPFGASSWLIQASSQPIWAKSLPIWASSWLFWALRERIWKKKKSHFLTFRYYLWQLVSVFMAQKILLCLTRWHLSRIAIDTQQYRGFTSILSNFGRLLCTFLTPNGIYMLHSDMCYCTYMINHDIKGAQKQQSDDHI